ncbi:4'-phosphopantetheinyl transferase [Bifidobacterium reuteri DSM 23975]|uniref:Holo-[acyl-carrier-protein] synthase n=2 Tax=Bifidobacterium reuteri TaxID=983706 RepID=A0A087CNW7_9BIFI|nr:4'-phosphopantetheinyl transferase [Bifidobacterium reuteri DSM 23975]
MAMGVRGLGHDVVDVAAFATQLAEPGTRMRSLFSVRELRQVSERARVKNDSEAVHLAVKWAGKEAFLKAWCEALGEKPYPFTLDDFPWREVEILDDSRGVPHVMLSGRAMREFRDSLAGDGPSTGSPSMPRISDGGVADRYTDGNGAQHLRADSADCAGPIPGVHISLSHDGPIASAVVMIAV